MHTNEFTHLLTLNNNHEEKRFQPKAILLREGEISKSVYCIESGCLRSFFLNDGKEVSFQFFFEGDIVCSFESFYNGQPSCFTLETLENTVVRVIQKEEFYKSLENTKMRAYYENKIIQRFIAYQKLFLSRIKNSPQERYVELLKEHPDIIRRVPQHYIASYLGITPVSLSRIRNRR